MKRALILLAAGCFICLGSCTAQKDKIPFDSFRLVVENLFDSNEAMMHFLAVEATGKRQIKITANKQTTLATIEPDANTNIMLAQIKLAATLSRYPKGAILEWTPLIAGPEGTVGGPTNMTVQAEKVKDVLQIEVKPGIYPLGQELEIGRLQGKPIVLLVE